MLLLVVICDEELPFHNKRMPMKDGIAHFHLKICGPVAGEELILDKNGDRRTLRTGSHDKKVETLTHLISPREI